MSKPTPAGATKCGSYCYLFKSTTNTCDCVISAHGGFMSENRSFTVPDNVIIHFYSDHGAALLDPGIASFTASLNNVLSRAVPKETITGGQVCRNYILSKYQGAHAGANGSTVVETYDQVARGVADPDAIRRNTMQNLLRNLAEGDDDQAQYKMSLLDRNWGGSILTIRNRGDVVYGVPLKDAIKAARKAMPPLRIFHCLFCRSAMLHESFATGLGHTMRPSQGVVYQ